MIEERNHKLNEPHPSGNKGETKSLVKDCDFFFTGDFNAVADERFQKHNIICVCTSGSATFKIGEKSFSLNDTRILVHQNNIRITQIVMCGDFKARCLFVSDKYLSVNMPETSYNTTGMLALLENPVMIVDEQHRELCLNVMSAIEQRFNTTNHLFYNEVLKRSVETLILDIYDSLARTRAYLAEGGNQAMRLFRQFVSLLQQGNYRENREVSWYADILCITPKYLSEVSIKASGHPASYWIDRFTTAEIDRLLHNDNLTVIEITERLNFTSLSYFSRYVKSRLGMSPKEYRHYLLGKK